MCHSAYGQPDPGVILPALAEARGSSYSAARGGGGMTRGRTLHLPTLLGTLAAAMVMVCAVALLAVSGEAEAASPSKNGRIAYNNYGVIYTIHPDGRSPARASQCA